MLVVSAGVIAFVLSLALPTVVKPLLTTLGVMDVPNERSSHERPVIRGLGLAVLIAMALAGVYAILTGAAGSAFWGFGMGSLGVVVGASLASGLLGLGEDLRGVSVSMRSVLLLLIAGVTAVLLVNPLLLTPENFARDGDASFGWGAQWERLAWPWWAQTLLVVYAILFISSYINVANFMDGLNGISGFHGVIAGLTFAAIGHVTDVTWLGVAGIVLAGGYLGFLPWNLTKPGAFLGDVGSYLLGGATAVTSFAAFMAGVPLLATIGPMVIYFGDVGVTLVKRMRAGHKWDEPHKEHVYQRINQLGYSHVAAAGMTAVSTAVASGLGFLSLYVDGLPQLALLAGGFLVFGLYLLLPKLLPNPGAEMRSVGH